MTEPGSVSLCESELTWLGRYIIVRSMEGRDSCPSSESRLRFV